MNITSEIQSDHPKDQVIALTTARLPMTPPNIHFGLLDLFLLTKNIIIRIDPSIY